MSKYVDVFGEILKAFIAPKYELRQTEGMALKNLQAVLEQKSMSDFLLYRYYEENDKGMGIYHMADGRKGIILRVFPTAFSSQKIETSVTTIMDNLKEEGTVVQFGTFASRNISHLLDNFKHLHHCNVNVENVDMLKEVVDDTYDFLESGIKKSIVKDLDCRIKDFVSTISILFPEDATDKYISQVYSQLLGDLRDLSPVNFEGQRLVTMLKEMLNPSKTPDDWNNNYDRHRVMNRQITSLGETVKTPTDCDYIEVGESWKYRTFTTKEFPNSKTILSGYDFYNLFFDRFGDSIQIPIPCPFFASLTIVIGDIDKSKEHAANKARKDIKNVRKIKRDIREQYPELDNRKKEAVQTIEYIEQEGEIPYKGMFQVTLMDSNLDDLNKYSKVLVNRFKNKNWSIEGEKFGNISLFVFLFSMNLQYNKDVHRWLQRDDLLFTSNAAAIAPLLGNIATNRMMIPFVDRNFQLIPYDNFSGDSYNEAKTGATGAGKSYTQAYAHIMKLAAGVKIRVIDNGASYRRFCKMVGGVYIDVGKNANISLNFFTKAKVAKVVDKNGEDTDEDIKVKLQNGSLVNTLHADEVSSIVPIIGLMVGLNLVVTGKEQNTEDATDEAYIRGKLSNAVILTFLLHQHEAKLEYTRDIIFEYAREEKDKGNDRESGLLYKLATGLFDFADKKGAHYVKFNTPNNLNMNSDYVVLETLGLSGIILDVVTVSLAHSVKAEFWEEGIKRQKSLDIDEGWMFKNNVIVVGILENNARTLRKSMSGQGFITQGIEDFSENSSMKALFASSYHKFLLAQDPKEILKVSESKFFPLDEYEKRVFTSVANKKPYWGEACYMSKKAPASAYIIKASPKTHWVAAGADPDGNKKFDQAQAKYKMTDMETVRFLVYKEQHEELSEYEIAQMAKSYSEVDRIKASEEEDYWQKEINSAIEENRIEVRAEPIESFKEDSDMRYEIFSRIRHKDKTHSSFAKYKKWLNQKELHIDYELRVIEKAFAYFEDSSAMLHFNITTDEAEDFDFKERFLNLISMYRMTNRVVLELKDTNSNHNIEKIQELISYLHGFGVKTAIDNVGIHYHKMSYLVMLDVDFIKVEQGLFCSDENSANMNVLKMIVSSSKYTKKQKYVIALKTEGQRHIDIVKEHEINMYQGWVLKEGEIVF